MLHNLFRAGYRPFFLFGAINAWASMATWLFVVGGGSVPTQGWAPAPLHAHEMLYGTVVPVIAGFLLTAVPRWTSSAPVAPGRLAALVALWLAGRIALTLAPAGPFSPLAVAAIDVAFLPALAWTVGRPIHRAGASRNYPVVGILLGLAVANAAIHAGLLAARPDWQRAGTWAAVSLVVGLMLVISGRVVPLFTGNALARSDREVPVATNRRVGGAAIAAAVAALGLDLVDPGGIPAGVAAAIAAPLLVLRQAGWRLRHVLDQPIVWVLHAGHAWIAVGFACQAASALGGLFPGASALHAFTAGAMGTLMLGMMSRVALGHGGHPLRASRATVAIYVLVIAGAALRVFGGVLAPAHYVTTILFAGTIWSAAWVLYTLAYARILTGAPIPEPAPG